MDVNPAFTSNLTTLLVHHSSPFFHTLSVTQWVWFCVCVRASARGRNCVCVRRELEIKTLKYSLIQALRVSDVRSENGVSTKAPRGLRLTPSPLLLTATQKSPAHPPSAPPRPAKKACQLSSIPPLTLCPPAVRTVGVGTGGALRIDPKIRRILLSLTLFSLPFSEDRWQIMAWLGLCFSHTCPPVASCQWGAVREVNWGKGYENKAQESVGFCSKKRKNGILSNNARHKGGKIRSTTRETATKNKLLSPAGLWSNDEIKGSTKRRRYMKRNFGGAIIIQ